MEREEPVLSEKTLKAAFDFFEDSLKNPQEPLNLQPWMRIVSPGFHLWLKDQARGKETVEDVYNRILKEAIDHFLETPKERQRRLNKEWRERNGRVDG